MTTGIVCTGHEQGLGSNCEGHAPPVTRLCGGCIREAKSLGRTIRRYTIAEQVQYAWGRPKKVRRRDGTPQAELEAGS